MNIEQICKDNKGLVVSMSMKYLKRFPMSYSVEDIKQIAWECMLKAIPKYDKHHDMKLGTFLAMCIRNGFGKELDYLNMKMRDVKKDIKSFDAPLLNDKNSTVTLHDKIGTNSNVADSSIAKVMYSDAKKCLTEKELLYFNLYYDKMLTLQEVGTQLGVTKQYASLVIQSVKKKISNKWKVKGEAK